MNLNYKPSYIKLNNPIRNLEYFKDFKGIEDIIGQKLPFPIFTNKYFVDQMDPSDELDPLRQLVLPNSRELEEYKEQSGSLDTSAEQTNWKAPGLQHKYGPTALALVSNVCASLCRECFRKRLFIEGKSSSEETTFPNEEAFTYLANNKEINSILLTGGDSLMLDDDSIGNILELLSDKSLDHITTVRFGTKIHSFYPERITPNLALVLQNFENYSGKKVHVSTHFEHKKELTSSSIASIELLRDHGINQYNQTVLLAGINDEAEDLFELFDSLSGHGVRPYYLFQCRPVMGSLQQQVSLKEGIAIVNKFNKQLTGVHKPRYAMSTPIGKLEILGVNPSNQDEVILRQHSAKDVADTGRIILYDVVKNNPFWYEPLC